MWGPYLEGPFVLGLWVAPRAARGDLACFLVSRGCKGTLLVASPRCLQDGVPSAEECLERWGKGLHRGELRWRVTAPGSGRMAVRWLLLRAGEPLGLSAPDGGEDGLTASVPRKKEDRVVLGSLAVKRHYQKGKPFFFLPGIDFLSEISDRRVLKGSACPDSILQGSGRVEKLCQ